MKKAVAIVSGGMDSVTLAYLLDAEGYQLHLLAFNYGQRHKKELQFAEMAAKALKAEFDIVDLSNLGKLLKGSALTDNIAVPDGYYASENMKITVVPNRNAIMLSIAYGVAVAEDADIVATGVHAGDHFIYPDCRTRFINALDIASSIGNEGFGNKDLKIYAPFAEIEKSQIVTIGSQVGVSYQNTWSCYKGGEKHCGKCGTCVERATAFVDAGVEDPTEYEDLNYFKTVVA